MLAAIGCAYARGGEYRLGLWYWVSATCSQRVPVTLVPTLEGGEVAARHDARGHPEPRPYGY